MYTLPYQIIRTKLRQAVPALKEVDWYLGQPENNDGHAMLFDLPAVYVRFEPLETEQLGGGVQRATVTISLYLVTDSVEQKGETRIGRGSPDKHARLTEAVFAALNGRTGRHHESDDSGISPGAPDDVLIFNSLTRTRVEPPHRRRKNTVSMQQFRATVYDYSARHAFRKIAARLQITRI